MNWPSCVCPLRYRYRPVAVAVAPERPAETLYVVGGLSGNPQMVATVEAMARVEPGPVTLCFNGDFNWLNVVDAGYRAINERALRHDAFLGNVETELGEDSDTALLTMCTGRPLRRRARSRNGLKDRCGQAKTARAIPCAAAQAGAGAASG